MNEPLVSVIIPCHNGSAYLDECIASVLDQKADCEIIVVDDGSTDDSAAHAQKLLRCSPGKMALICQRNQGPATARNTGLRSAQGKYICFLDVDDRYSPGFFATALQVMEPDPSIVAVVCQIEVIDAHRVVEPWQRAALENSLPSNLIMRTEAAKQTGGFPTDRAFRGRAAGEDIAFRRHLYAQGKVLMTQKPGLKYRAHRGSHLDFFLDRVTLRDGQRHFLHLSQEETDGSLGKANHQYDESIRERVIARTSSQLATSFDSAVKFHHLTGKYGPVEGFLHPIEGFALYWLARHWPVDGWTVEIGSFKGRSTCWLATGCKEGNKGKIAAVDHFRGSPEHQRGGSHEDKDIAQSGSTLPIFERTLGEFGLADWVTAHVGTSADVSSRWGEPIRMLFIDGDHSYEATSQDFRLWSRHIVPHGLVAFHDVGVWPGVTQFYTELCSHDDWEPIGRYASLGVLRQRKQGKQAEAVAKYRRALQVDPNSGEALKALAQAHKNQGALEEAAACFRQALQLYPDDVEAYNNLGWVLINLGQPTEAVVCFRKALELNPDHSSALNNLGVVLAMQGQVDEAISSFQQALLLNPQYVDALSNLGRARKQQGQLDEAVSCFRQVLLLDPQHANAQTNLNAALQALGQLDVPTQNSGSTENSAS